MKKLWMISLVLILSFSLVLTGCGGNNNAGNDVKEPDAASNEATEKPDESTKDANKETPANLSGEIDIWTWSPQLYEVLLPGFNKKYPNIKVNIVTMGDVPEKLKTALAAGTGAPDVVQTEVGRYHEFNSIEGFENLLLPPYNAGRYKDDFPEGYWKQHHSLDGKRMWGIPSGAAPAVTFYRADIMEENGFPSDPEELAEYMEDPENFLAMAQTLRAQDKYILEFNDILLWLKGTGSGFFDQDLNYVRNKDEYVEFLDISKQVKQLDLAANMSMWSDEGKQAMNTGKFAMLYGGDWWARPNRLQEYAPDTAGKWRVTRLPLGIHGKIGGSALMIPSQSKKKDLAWAFIEYALLTTEAQVEHAKIFIFPAFKPAWTAPEVSETKTPFFGDQIMGKIFASVADKTPVSYSTSLDPIAGKIWFEGIRKAIEQNQDSRAAIQQIADEVEKAVAPEREKLLQNK
jgi:multiple sugar transport system substrate-binding protein